MFSIFTYHLDFGTSVAMTANGSGIAVVRREVIFKTKLMKDIKLIDKGRLRVSLAWYDIWIGLFVDTIKKKLYVCPLPGLLITLRYGVSSG